MGHETRDHLSWLAMQYVLGEMTDDQRLAFERRLADDEAACDAVEQAVEMTEALRLGGSEPLSVPRSRLAVFIQHSATWAACLLLAASLAWLASLGRQRPQGELANSVGKKPATSTGSQQAGVSLAWAVLRQQHASEASGDAALSWPDPAAAAGLEAAANLQNMDQNIDASAPTVPQWLLTAVSAGSPPSKETQ